MLGAFGDVSAVQLLLAILAPGGLIAAITAIYKLRPDVNSAAVTQAAGAMDVMKELNATLNQENVRLRQDMAVLGQSLAECRKVCYDLEKELTRLRNLKNRQR